MQLESLYQQVIIQHYRHPHNRGVLEAPDAEVHLHNPTCGDEITLQLQVRDGNIADVRFSGHGCSISQASASMMTRQLKGKPLAEADALAARFTEMMHGNPEAATDRKLGELRALAGVSRFPVRIRCALLAWNALSEAEKQVRGGAGESKAAG
ncbi:SUF system NifU family Fe-S cluster assembly protein [soil metagenome]